MYFFTLHYQVATLFSTYGIDNSPIFERVAIVVIEQTGVPADSMIPGCRSARAAYGRHMQFYILHKHYGYTPAELSEAFRCSRSAIHKGVRNIENWQQVKHLRYVREDLLGIELELGFANKKPQKAA